MKSANRYFTIGIIAALSAFILLGGNSILSSVIAGLNLARLPRELRLGLDTGLIQRTECSAGFLNSSCRSTTFNNKVAIMLEQIGALEEGRKGLAKTGIISKNKTYLKRKEALEILARVCIYLAHKRLIALPLEDATNYQDYPISGKYSQAIRYMQQKFVIRGYPNGTFGANRTLSNREALSFIYRLYEAVAAGMMTRKTATGIRFVDIPLSHPIMNNIRVLTQAGAFDKVMLRPAFDGDSNISTNEVNDMLEGIFSRNNQSLDQIRIRTIFAGDPGTEKMTRRQLALVLDYLSNLADLPSTSETVTYLDVEKDSAEFSALNQLARLEIYLGYKGGYFRGYEKVSWFECVSALSKILKLSKNTGVTQEESSPDRLAQKKDIEDYMAVLKAKQLKIRRILNRKRFYRR
jgi:hypothetical protein